MPTSQFNVVRKIGVRGPDQAENRRLAERLKQVYPDADVDVAADNERQVIIWFNKNININYVAPAVLDIIQNFEQEEQG